jgi:hypothetical protein
MNIKNMSRKIAEKVKEKYDVVTYSKFCDECDVDYVPEEELAKTVEEVIVENCSNDVDRA